MSLARRRTPQLMSYPTPPGETTPSSGSNAATPPTGKPYPERPSGMARELPPDDARAAVDTGRLLQAGIAADRLRQAGSREHQARHPNGPRRGRPPQVIADLFDHQAPVRGRIHRARSAGQGPHPPVLLV